MYMDITGIAVKLDLQSALSHMASCLTPSDTPTNVNIKGENLLTIIDFLFVCLLQIFSEISKPYFYKSPPKNPILLPSVQEFEHFCL